MLFLDVTLSLEDLEDAKPARLAAPDGDGVDEVAQQRLRHLPFGRALKSSTTSYQNVQWFRGGLVFKAHRLLYHSTRDLRVMKRKKKKRNMVMESMKWLSSDCGTCREGVRESASEQVRE